MPWAERREQVIEAVVVAAALATIPLTILQLRGATGGLLDDADWAIWAVFLGEFVLLAIAAARLRRPNWHAAAALAVTVLSFPVLPQVFAFVRLVRLVRLARLTRLFRLTRLTVVVGEGFDMLHRLFRRPGLLSMVILTGFLIVAGGGLLAVLEPGTVHGGFVAGVWWAFVTASTVGYGDIAPVTVWGRLVAVALMLAGIGLFSTLAAAVAAHFVEQDRGSDIQEIKAQLERIEALLLVAAMSGAGGAGAAVPGSTPAPDGEPGGELVPRLGLAGPEA